MEFKGTKGKWELSSYENMNGRMLFVVQNKSFDSRPNDLLIHITSFSEVETQKANALLISKAPEMLEMLKDIYSQYEKDGHLLNVSPSKIKQLIKEATEL